MWRQGSASLLLAMLSLPSMATTVMPTRYEAGHFYATPTLRDGETLRLLVDTGGGWPTWVLPANQIKRLGLPPLPGCVGIHGFFQPPAFKSGSALPALDPRGCAGVYAATDDPYNVGMVGAWYLSAGIWTFDYPGQRLTLEDAAFKPGADARPVALGFPLNAEGKLAAPYPRITLDIAGESLDLLLDTGATAHPSPAGLKAMGTAVAADGLAAGSYITRSVMNRWHAAHPDWPLVEQADDLFGPTRATRAIRVPWVAVAGWRTGPIWFIERSDGNFGDQPGGMSSFMDGEVHGAAGGNIWSAFRLTVDYPRRTLWLHCVTSCRDSTP